MPLRRLALVALTVVLPGASAAAQSVTIGTPAPNGGNSFPFNSFNSNGNTRYQQVYSAGAFGLTGGPVGITSLTFFNNAYAGATIASGNYVVRLSTTSASVGGLSTTFAANVGSDVQTFYAGNLGGLLTITGATPFFYNATLGNLLLDVTVSGQTDNGTFLDRTISPDPNTSRVYGTGSQGTADTQGLVTRFAYYTPSSVVPEPSTWALVGGGLVSLAGVAARRRRAVTS